MIVHLPTNSFQFKRCQQHHIAQHSLPATHIQNRLKETAQRKARLMAPPIVLAYLPVVGVAKEARSVVLEWGGLVVRDGRAANDLKLKE